MEVTFVVSAEFKRQFKRLAKKYRSLSSDLRLWQQEFVKNPQMGVDLGAGLRKVRIAIASKSKGKSGGARILTFNALVREDNLNVTLLTIYDKGEVDNISDDYLKYLVSTLYK